MRTHVKNNPDSSEIQRRAADMAFRVNLKMDVRNYRQRKLLAAAETRTSIKKCRRSLKQERQVFTALKNEAGQTTNSKRSMEMIVEKFYKDLYSSKNAGIDPGYVGAIRDCYENATTTIKLFEREISIPIKRGVRQGDTISPKLFTTALQYAMKNLEWDGYHTNLDGKNITNLRFAYDIVLCAKNPEEAQRMLNSLNEVDLTAKLCRQRLIKFEKCKRHC
ncbi:hypothetical protein OESDEN_09621 [Oesophagostomum dentatum]|uniref:Reverse transcriptase domain-containing protein n=1 Tax=Oesophagostomum dentatum TaxID=61180 RepID=A0A0B1T427_OESDE|nr:hypothetical protein OESDEN_09621 [Oesophagostomum dentatum]